MHKIISKHFLKATDNQQLKATDSLFRSFDLIEHGELKPVITIFAEHPELAKQWVQRFGQSLSKVHNAKINHYYEMEDILKEELFEGASRNDEDPAECANKHLRKSLQSPKDQKVLNVWTPLGAWDKKLTQSTSQEEWQKEEILNQAFDDKNTNRPPFLRGHPCNNPEVIAEFYRHHYSGAVIVMA